MNSNLVFGLVIAVCIVVMWTFTRVYRELLAVYEQSGALTDLEYSWFFRLLLNLAGYATVLVPVFILYKYLQRTNYFDKVNNPTRVSRLLFACFGPYERLADTAATRRAASASREGIELAFCFTGLMGAYLVWGLLQEKIMTQKYVMEDGSIVRFTDSTFLVLVNRLGALVVGVSRLACARRVLVPAPLASFACCALTNVLSAWCQYEALKYVSFPTQVLSKSCKVIPVMVMGTVVSRVRYAAHEYGTAALISLGMVLFMFGANEHLTVREASITGTGTMGGLALLTLYLCCDSFTSNWQSALFARYPLHPLQMLCAVNLWSVLLTVSACAGGWRSGAGPPWLPLLAHPAFLADCLVLSVSSALGQLLIYRTIANFGAVVFAIIMTLRQAVSILLSCLVYGHAVSASGAGGVVLVFTAVLLRLYVAHRTRARGGKGEKKVQG